MEPDQKQRIQQYLETIAQKEGISPKKVRDEIALAISLAQKSTDPKIQNFWNSIPCEGTSPTVEETIDYLAKNVSSHKGSD